MYLQYDNVQTNIHNTKWQSTVTQYTIDKVQLHNIQLTISNEYTYDTNTQYTIYINTTITECNFTWIYLCVCNSVQSQLDASLSSIVYKV